MRFTVCKRLLVRPNELLGLARVDWSCMQFNAKRPYQFDDGVVPRLCARRKRFVQTLPSEASVFGQFAHAASLCNVSDSLKEDIGVFVLQALKKGLCSTDVLLLGKFVSRAQEQVGDFASPTAVQTIAWADVYPHF